MTDQPKILIVEDEAGMAGMLAFVLRRAGHGTAIARTGKEGLRLATEQEYALITLDLNLPDMSGFEVCRQLKAQLGLRDIPIVIVSGQLAEINRAPALALGAADYLEKPFEPGELVSRIGHQLNRHQRPADALPTH